MIICGTSGVLRLKSETELKLNPECDLSPEVDGVHLASLQPSSGDLANWWNDKRSSLSFLHSHQLLVVAAGG